MRPSPGFSHQYVAANIGALLRSHVEKNQLGLVLHAPFDLVPAEDVVLQPDVFYLSRERCTRQQGLASALPVRPRTPLGEAPRDRAGRAANPFRHTTVPTVRCTTAHGFDGRDNIAVPCRQLLRVKNQPTHPPPDGGPAPAGPRWAATIPPTGSRPPTRGARALRPSSSRYGQRPCRAHNVKPHRRSPAVGLATEAIDLLALRPHRAPRRWL